MPLDARGPTIGPLGASGPDEACTGLTHSGAGPGVADGATVPTVGADGVTVGATGPTAGATPGVTATGVAGGVLAAPGVAGGGINTRRAGSQRASTSPVPAGIHSPLRTEAGRVAGADTGPPVPGGPSSANVFPANKARLSPTAFARERFMPAPPTAQVQRFRVTPPGYVGVMTVQPANFL